MKTPWSGLGALAVCLAMGFGAAVLLVANLLSGHRGSALLNGAALAVSCAGASLQVYALARLLIVQTFHEIVQRLDIRIIGRPDGDGGGDPPPVH